MTTYPPTDWPDAGHPHLAKHDWSLQAMKIDNLPITDAQAWELDREQCIDAGYCLDATEWVLANTRSMSRSAAHDIIYLR